MVLRKTIFFIMMACFAATVCAKDFSDIKSFKVNAKEKTVVNKREKKKEYLLTVKFPDKVLKEMKSPEVNRGELYAYNGNKKTIYIPLLNQKSEKSIDEDENYIIKIMKEIRAVDMGKAKNGVVENANGVYKVDMEKGVVTEALCDENRIVFSNFENINGINFPKKVEVYEKKSLVSAVEFSDVKINENIPDTLFQIK